jgi:hypothetical protein
VHNTKNRPMLRTYCSQSSDAFESLRSLCADGKHAVVLTDGEACPYEKPVILGTGAMSVIIQMKHRRCDGVVFALKMDKADDTKWNTFTKNVTSISTIEVDATFLMWKVLGVSGMSPHIPRPYGMLPVTIDASMAPLRNKRAGSASMALFMECMTGIKVDGCTIMDFREYLQHGIKAYKCDVDMLSDTVPAIMFQVMHAIAMWSTATNTGFRHNDLHAGNVCLTYWNKEHTAVDVEYHLCGPDGKDYAFMVSSPICATIIDYGSAALLPHAGGPQFDGRFYFYNHCKEPLSMMKNGSLREVKFHDFGISHRQPSKHYDTCLFTYAVLHAFNAGDAHPAGVQYASFYDRCFGKLYSNTKFFHQFDKCGRLTAAAQVALMQVDTLTINKRVVKVMDAQHALMDPYFARFRCESTIGSCTIQRRCFGVRHSENATQSPLTRDAMLRTSSVLAGRGGPWRPVISDSNVLLNAPLPGLWSTISSILHVLRSKCPLGTILTLDESIKWANSCKEETVFLESPVPDLNFKWSESEPAANMC